MNLFQERDIPRPSQNLAVLAALAGDIPNFATGGVTVLLGQKTN